MRQYQVQMTTSPPRGRFAPSPTGPLHFGSLVAALGSWMMARRAGGEWLVRIEDVDGPRTVPGAAERQLATLHAFGLVPDGPVEWQSRRGVQVAATLARLVASGDVFECRCSRADLQATGGRHRACVAAPARRPAALRLRVPDASIGFDDAVQGHYAQHLGNEVGDIVLRRADGPWAYQLAVVVDDAAQGIDEVVRGADLLDSTPRQILLQRRLGLPTPRYAHLPIALDATGAKLSKSLRSLPVDDDDPLPALRAAWTFLGQPPSALPTLAPARALRAALDAFDPARIPRRREIALEPSPGGA